MEGLSMATATVRTRQGEVRGSQADDMYTFKGIPYAAPPFGANRFRPPQPPAPWSGVRDALTFGAEPFQLRLPPEWQAAIPDPTVQGEDCLNLNVWTPALANTRLPVMVYIPGGMFEIGTGASYNGSRFARDGIVCVSLNYRVGAESFLFLEDSPANRGLLDQVAALGWVRDNIAAFGGDPDRVTIFGESAGAMSVGTLLGLPLAEGLFRRAIAQSGAAHLVNSADAARQIGLALADKLGVPATRDAIATLPMQRFLDAQIALKTDLLAHPDPLRWGSETVVSTMPWQPVIDGEIIPAAPIQRIAGGASAQVDVMLGTNTDDWKLFTVLNGYFDRVTEDMLAGPVADYGFLSLAAYGLPANRALAAYQAQSPGTGAGDLLAAVQTAWWVRIPAIRLAEAHTGNPGGTFMYEFAWPSPAENGRFGACHGLEIPFVFDTLDKGANQVAGTLLGVHPPQPLADVMHAAWVAFATNGAPGWPEYDLDRRPTMRFDTRSGIVNDPYPMERALWAGVR
jgi:para-nitrobenzyl esterase